ncbi:MAG: lysozyme [Bacteroidales bacterium]|nr:lysozyme [Bacteroidales bacterium]
MKKLITSLVIVPFLMLTVPVGQLKSEKFIEDLEVKKTLTPEEFNTRLDESEKLNYEKAIEFIKIHEGFAGGQAYTCVSGHPTIGYGHVIGENEEFPEQITLEFADSLLRSDVKKAYKTANKLYPELHGSRKVAITHFLYSKGIGAFLKSGLKKQIDANGDVDEEFGKWCYYKNHKTGNKVYSKVAARIQKWETEMWHADDDTYSYSPYSR